MGYRVQLIDWQTLQKPDIKARKRATRSQEGVGGRMQEWAFCD